ncbi:peptidyl-prolyl cis-trans isomerase FKBP11 isoform X2 [Meriones unguiculatus]|uniref:peptidyl-prolyl cis-trans isomerase FKBP11 isoform X2 n=1 Tax=Meriones unguiculatus TaxID=10047 RepID=UPI00293EBF42|nr:peptidyl-prolyl cis-trans isomerase FKBP11 isoform X2 [Meriones unguiculatus]
MSLRPLLLPLSLPPLLLLLLSGAGRRAEAGPETESPVRTLQVETLVQPPEPCTESAAYGDTLHIHYTGSLVGGRIIDTSLNRDPLVIELGQKQVIPGLEQTLLDMCVGEKRRAVIPSHLAYGKRGYPPSIPGDCHVGMLTGGTPQTPEELRALAARLRFSPGTHMAACYHLEL